MRESISESRRRFLRNSIGVAAIGTAFGDARALASPVEAPVVTADSTTVARVTLDKELYDSDGVLNGTISYRVPPAGDTTLEWIDSFGRTTGQWNLAKPPALNRPQSFSFRL